MASAVLSTGFNMDAIRTKSVERTLAPLVQQVTTLANSAETGHVSNRKKGKSKNGSVLVAAVERSIENFVENSASIIRENPDAAHELVKALDDVKRTGAEMVASSREFVGDACSSQRRTKMVAAARALLTAVARLLIIADMIDVRLLLEAVQRVKGNLDHVKGAASNQELTERFGAMRAEMDYLSEETRKRLNDLRNPGERDDLQAARALLKTNSPIMYTASKAFVRHPEIDPARLNRDFAHSEMSKALQAMDDVIQGRTPSSEVGMSQYGRIGDLIAELDKFQNRVYLDPAQYRDKKHRPELEEMLERIVSGAAHIADSENTRDDRKQRIVAECNALRQALQDLLTEYERNAGRKEPSEELDLALVHIGHKAKDLRRHLRRAVVDHVSDAFLDTRVPLLVLIDAAQRQDEQGVEDAGRMFIEHAGKLVEVRL
uniref:Uncharacterized protein n=1 Tax=Plectus sambesii TaxID=2011161 RepID=A0A914V136_9BILA